MATCAGQPGGMTDPINPPLALQPRHLPLRRRHRGVESRGRRAQPGAVVGFDGRQRLSSASTTGPSLAGLRIGAVLLGDPH